MADEAMLPKVIGIAAAAAAARPPSFSNQSEAAAKASVIESMHLDCIEPWS